MSQNPLPHDAVDDLLSDYFKSKMRQPWPAAPAAASAEPSALHAARHADRGNRSRYTLAASVALLIGICWYFSNGSQPGERALKPAPSSPGILDDGSAKMPKEFEKTKKAKDPMGLPSGPMLN